MSDDDDCEVYESGPFCIHWADPWDCDELCACGHVCAKHGLCTAECSVDGCACEKFVEVAPQPERGKD